MFSSFGCIHNTYQDSTHTKDIKVILRIQDKYIELAWRYLVYRYGEQRAVLYFFLLHNSIGAPVKIEEYNTMIDSIVQQTEASLRTSE